MTKFFLPAAALDQHVAILGKTGSGKTWTAKVIVEHALRAGRQTCGKHQRPGASPPGVSHVGPDRGTSRHGQRPGPPAGTHTSVHPDPVHTRVCTSGVIVWTPPTF